MNLFELLNQYNKSSFKTYGDILNDNLNPANNLTKVEKELYNQYKNGDLIRFKINENKKLISNPQPVNQHVSEISGIGVVTQIC